MTFIHFFSSLLLGSLSLVKAIPHLTFPLNAQIPPLAVVSKPFSFTISPSTFSYNTPSITYSTLGIPSWLSFDASTRTFTGIPAAADVGNFTFTLRANDTTGSATGEVTLLVVQDDGVSIGATVESQLSSFGGVDGMGGIVLENEKGFTWQFSQNTFTVHNVPIQTYYAVSTGHIPLPSWIKFSPKNITFTGSAPEVFSRIAPPQYFPITLIASTHRGFASASQTFNVVIGAHSLTVDPTPQVVNATIGRNMSYQLPLSAMELDRQKIHRADIASAVADLGQDGNWLTFDPATLVLSGQPAKGDRGTSVAITVTDKFVDSVRLKVRVNLSDGLFLSNIPSIMNATFGEEFSFVFNDTQFAVSDVQLSVTFDPQGGDNWLTYYSKTRTISGTPSAGKAKSVQVNLIASSLSLNETRSASFTVRIVTSDPVASGTSSSLTSPSNKSLIITLSVILPVVAIVAGAAIAVWCLRRRNSRRKSSRTSMRENSPIPPNSRSYSPTPDSDWPLAEEKSFGEPRQLGGLSQFMRGMSGLFTFNAATDPPETDPTGGDNSPRRAKESLIPMLGGVPKAAAPSWRRSDGRDWGPSARSSDASVATVNTDEIFSVRLVQSPITSGWVSVTPEIEKTSPLRVGKGAVPAASVNSPVLDAGKLDEASQRNGRYLEAGFGTGYEENRWEPADRVGPPTSRGSTSQPRETSRNSRYSLDSFRTRHEVDDGRGTLYPKSESSQDTIEQAIEYPVKRVSGPLRPMSTNLPWDGNSLRTPTKPLLLDMKGKRVESLTGNGQRSGELTLG